MYAFIKNNEISFISPTKIPQEWDWEFIEFDNVNITDPVFMEWAIKQKEIPEYEPTAIEKKISIGNKILEEVFDNNPHAQIADLTKSQVTMLAMLVPIIGKEAINMNFADLIATLKQVSEARVANGLEPFDLSFLDE